MLEDFLYWQMGVYIMYLYFYMNLLIILIFEPTTCRALVFAKESLPQSAEADRGLGRGCKLMHSLFDVISSQLKQSKHSCGVWNSLHVSIFFIPFFTARKPLLSASASRNYNIAV